VNSSSQVEKDLLEALARLSRGEPTHPELVASASEGKLKISPASVAKEARRSRTLIGMENCQYPDIRRKVLASKEQTPLQMRRSAALQALRSEVRRLEAVIKVKDTALATVMLRVASLERRIERYEPLDAKVASIGQRKESSRSRE
jgi:hypothetical protein